jgi:hypothetical protein
VDNDGFADKDTAGSIDPSGLIPADPTPRNGSSRSHWRTILKTTASLNWECFASIEWIKQHLTQKTIDNQHRSLLLSGI